MEWIIIVFGVLLVSFIVISLVKQSLDEQDRTDIPSGTHKPTHELRGLQGESKINHDLKKLIRNDECLFTNILLPLKNGNKTEIDSILLSRKGIFCIEIKNWVGHISGNEESEYWIQKYDDPYMMDKKHKNPFKQNENHCRVLERTLNYEYDVYNIILFPFIEDRDELYSPSTFEIDEFMRYYRNLPDRIHIDDLEEIKDKISCFQATNEELRKHKEQIKKDYGENQFF